MPFSVVLYIKLYFQILFSTSNLKLREYREKKKSIYFLLMSLAKQTKKNQTENCTCIAHFQYIYTVDQELLF